MARDRLLFKSELNVALIEVRSKLEVERPSSSSTDPRSGCASLTPSKKRAGAKVRLMSGSSAGLQMAGRGKKSAARLRLVF